MFVRQALVAFLVHGNIENLERRWDIHDNVGRYILKAEGGHHVVDRRRQDIDGPGVEGRVHVVDFHHDRHCTQRFNDRRGRGCERHKLGAFEAFKRGNIAVTNPGTAGNTAHGQNLYL